MDLAPVAGGGLNASKDGSSHRFLFFSPLLSVAKIESQKSLLYFLLTTECRLLTTLCLSLSLYLRIACRKRTRQ
jgi:hypothetical protein